MKRRSLVQSKDAKAPVVVLKHTEAELLARSMRDWYKTREERDAAWEKARAEARKNKPLTEEEEELDAAGLAMPSPLSDETVARRFAEEPSEMVSWHEVAFVEEHLGEAESTKLYKRVADDARFDLECGHFLAKSLVPYGIGPLEYARIQAIRDGLRDEWQPQGQTEEMLIDMLVQTRWQYERWMAKHSQHIEDDWMQLTADEELRKKYGTWVPERLNRAEAQEHSMGMAVKWQNQFIKLVRSLRDLRRMGSQIVVQSGGQVNVGAQQINSQALKADAAGSRD